MAMRRSRRAAARRCSRTSIFRYGSGEGIDGGEPDRWHEGQDLFPQAAAACRRRAAERRYRRRPCHPRLFRTGPVSEDVWTRFIQPEKDREPDKKGFAVLIAVERAEALDRT